MAELGIKVKSPSEVLRALGYTACPIGHSVSGSADSLLCGLGQVTSLLSLLSVDCLVYLRLQLFWDKDSLTLGICTVPSTTGLQWQLKPLGTARVQVVITFCTQASVHVCIISK